MVSGMGIDGIQSTPAPLLRVVVAQQSPSSQATPATQAPAPQPSEALTKHEESQPSLVLSPEALRNTAEALGQAIEAMNNGVRVQFDDSTDRFVMQIVDRESDEVVRQIPSEELLNVVRRVRDLVGVLLDLEI